MVGSNLPSKVQYSLSFSIRVQASPAEFAIYFWNSHQSLYPVVTGYSICYSPQSFRFTRAYLQWSFISSLLLQQNHASLHCILKCVVFPFILEHYSMEKQFKHALKHKPIFCFLSPVELPKTFDIFPTRSFYLQSPRFLILTSIHNVAIK